MREVSRFWVQNHHFNFSQNFFLYVFLKLYLMTSMKDWVNVLGSIKENSYYVKNGVKLLSIRTGGPLLLRTC